MDTIEELTENIWNCKECNLNKDHLKEYYGGSKNAEYMLVFQNPGQITDKFIKKYGEGQLKDIEEWKKGFHEYWVIGNEQKDFFEWFFSLFGKNSDYIKNQEYWKDFYITDAVKCCGNESDMDRVKRERKIQPCYNFLKKEIEIIKPKLIISFGSRIQDFFYGFNPKPVSHNEKFGKVTKSHGYLYRCNDFFLIPSAHISKRGRMNCLRNSFFDYLGEGIKKYKNTQSYPV